MGSVALGAFFALTVDSQIVLPLYFVVTALVGVALKFCVRRYDQNPDASLATIEGLFYLSICLGIAAFGYVWAIYKLPVFTFPEALFLLLTAIVLLAAVIFVQRIFSEKRSRVQSLSTDHAKGM